MELFPISPAAAPTDITLALMPMADGLHAAIHADGGLFNLETVKRMLRRLRKIFEDAADDMNFKPKNQSMLTSDDSQEVAKFSMGEERPTYVTSPLLHEAFEVVAASSIDRRCLCYEGEWLTYGELDARASQVAANLSALGVGPGSVVGLMIDRSFDLIVSILGILKAGGCYLPCDPAYPDDRLAVYLEDGGAKVMLVQAHLSSRAEAMVGPNVRIVDIGALGEVSSDVVVKRAGPEDPCYIIFTSGSTGRPKGVVVAHRGLRDLLPWLVDRHGIGRFYLAEPGMFK